MIQSSRRPRVTAILPRGEAIRNFVYSGSLDEVARHASLDVLSVIPSAGVREDLGRRYGRIDELREYPERYPVRILREILDMAHGRWLWSEAAQERWRLRDQDARALRRRLKRWGKKVCCLPFANRPGLRVMSAVERTASRVLSTTDCYKDHFRRTQPTLVFNASHVHSRVATQAVQAAQWLGIPTATFVFSWDNLTSQGRILLPYDYYCVWNDEIRAQFLEIYPHVPPEQVVVTGTPQFDFHFDPRNAQSRTDFCAHVGADPSRPIVFYSTGMANHMPGEPEIVEGIADALAGLPQRPQLLVRVYPKDRTGRFEALQARRRDILFPGAAWDPNWLTPLPEDAALLAGCVRHAAVGINVASTLSLELCMFDRPVVNVGYNPPGVPRAGLDYARYYRFDHYRPLVESGAVRVAASRDELRRMVVEELEAPGVRSPQRAELLARMFGDTLDGRSGSRIARVLVEWAR